MTVDISEIDNSVKEAILLDFCIKFDAYIKENDKRMSQNAMNQVISSIIGKPLHFKKTKRVKKNDDNDEKVSDKSSEKSNDDVTDNKKSIDIKKSRQTKNTT